MISALLTATLGLGAASARIVPELEVSGTSRQLQDASDAPAEEETSEDSGFYSTVDPRLSEDMFNAVLGLFDTWNAALATLDSATVADLYAPNAVLLPTVSNDVRTDRAGIIDYFDYFLSIKPDGVLDEYDIRLEHTDEEGAPDMVSNSGIYTFTSGVDGSTVQARYTFVYAKQPDGEWLILTHHSSEMPEELVPREQDGSYLSDSTSTSELTEPETEGVLKAFKKWNAALETFEPENMRPLYTRDAVLLPTASGDVRTTLDEIEDYFVVFMKDHPSGVMDEYNIRLLGRDENGIPSAVSNQGIYTFTMAKTGKVTQARFTFDYLYIDGEWLIHEHHSSAMPEVTE